MSEIWQFDPVLVGREMHEITAWLEANMVVAGDVPVDAVVVFAGGDMTVDVHLRKGGLKYVGDDGEIARGKVTVPLLVPPPPFKALVRPLSATPKDGTEEPGAAS